MRRTPVCVLSLLMVHCGAIVQPDGGEGEGGMLARDASHDSASSDADPTACLPLQSCERDADCPVPCGLCQSLFDFPDALHTGRPRILTKVCVPRLLSPYPSNNVGCDEPFGAVWTYGEDDDLPLCLPRDVCLAAQRLQQTLGSTQFTRRCMSSDGTAYLGDAIRAEDCHGDIPLFCTTRCRCGGDRTCAFLSENPAGLFGYCAPAWRAGESPVGSPCRSGSNRVSCRGGLACLQPLRYGAGGISDENRWGICLPPDECTRATISTIPPSNYHCDMSAAPDAGR